MSIDAIVCAYNEKDRIGNILKELGKVKELGKIIVIDDGSEDGTYKICEKYKKVVCLRNKHNKGKGYSMNKGVLYSNAKYILFCDADLVGFDSKIIKEIILPVINKKADMFIGLCGSWNQSFWSLVMFNSGQRALKREIWLSLPKFYKDKFRIEYGLNKFVMRNGFCCDYKKLDYNHVVKEVKHGIIKGSILRMYLNYDVGLAMARYYLYDYFNWSKH